MKQLVLTGHTGQNPRYPLSQIAQFIIKYKQHKGKVKKALERELLSIIHQGSAWGGFILLDLDEKNKLKGVLVMMAGEPGDPNELQYLATTTSDAISTRQQLLRSAMKISRGIVAVKCDLSTEDEAWLSELSYRLDRQTDTIHRIGG